MRFFNIILLINLSVVSVHSARILAWFPFPSISHQVVFRPVTHELAKRGHEVVVITTDPAFPPGKAPPNLTEIDFHEKSYEIWRELVTSNNLRTGETTNALSVMRLIMIKLTKAIEMQINSKEVQNLLKNEAERFDLIIMETSGRSLLPLKQDMNIPLILFSSFGAVSQFYDAMGAPTRPLLLYPIMFRQKLNNLTLVDKLSELFKDYLINSMFDESPEYEKQFIRNTFGPDVSVDYREMMKNIDLLFLNINPIWDQNRPVPPGVVYLGGLHQKPEKELPKEWKSYLDSSRNGVIYVSFGTNVSPSHLPPERIQLLVKVFSQLPYDILWKWDKDELTGRTANIRIANYILTQLSEWKSYLDSSRNGVIYVSFGTNVSPSHLPPERIQLLVKVFSQLPYDILWKWDKDELTGRTANIRIAKWLPQSDLLRHPKVKVFITQCGLQSTDEAITAGVPLIGMPMLGDQWYNAEMYEKHKIGIRADLSDLTEAKLMEVIDTIIKDESYRKNIEKLRRIMQDQPQTPLERAVWWTEYVIRHGGAKHLRAPAANMTWAEYLDLELLAAIAGIVLTALAIVVFSVYLLVSFIKKRLFPAAKLKKS